MNQNQLKLRPLFSAPLKEAPFSLGTKHSHHKAIQKPDHLRTLRLMLESSLVANVRFYSCLLAFSVPQREHLPNGKNAGCLSEAGGPPGDPTTAEGADHPRGVRSLARPLPMQLNDSHQELPLCRELVSHTAEQTVKFPGLEPPRTQR